MFGELEEEGTALERRHNIRIKSKFRFITFLVLLILAVGIGFSWITGMNVINGVTEPNYTTVEVSAGDTLWDIANRCSDENQDVRKTVYEIRHLNNLTSSTLTTGQTIKVPIQ